MKKIPRKNSAQILYAPTTRRKDRPEFDILLQPLSLDPPPQKVYITHPKAMTVANLVDIFYTTDYITHKS